MGNVRFPPCPGFAWNRAGLRCGGSGMSQTRLRSSNSHPTSHLRQPPRAQGSQRPLTPPPGLLMVHTLQRAGSGPHSLQEAHLYQGVLWPQRRKPSLGNEANGSFLEDPAGLTGLGRLSTPARGRVPDSPAALSWGPQSPVSGIQSLTLMPVSWPHGDRQGEG